MAVRTSYIQPKKVLQIDLTPLVDINLLLISCYMFFAVLAIPKAMLISMPFPQEEHYCISRITNEIFITILLSQNHKIYYYYGANIQNDNDLQLTDFANLNGIREILANKKMAINDLINKGELRPYETITVIIKPDSNSLVLDWINIIDEMKINVITNYAIVDILPEEQELIKQYNLIHNY